MERLLVSTAIEESWIDAEPMLFLGEWCRHPSRRHRWEDLDIEVVPYHWSDRAKVEGDRRYLDDLYEVLLGELADELNERHGVDHGIRYWRILLGPWLGFVIQEIFDRWETISAAVSGFHVSGTIVLEGLPDARTAYDMADHLALTNSWEWNHHLSSMILQGFTNVDCLPKAVADEPGFRLSWDPVEPAGPMSLAHWLVVAGSDLLSRCTSSTDALVINSGLRSLRDELTLQRRLGQVPCLRRVEQPVCVAAESDQRGWSLGEADPGSFDSCVRKLVPWLLPSAYLEGYGSLGAQINRLRWPERPSVVFTSASHFYDDVFKAWCAEKVEAGAPLVIGQHGGHVGIGWSFVHDHQMEIADRFLSWGWEAAKDPKVVPVGMLKAPVLPDRPLDGDGRAVLILGNETAQLTSLTSSALSSQFNDYLEELHTFAEELTEEVRGELTVRLSRHDIDWEVGERWRSRHPEVALDDGHRSVLDLLSETRLFITTNNGTTFLESIYLDVPTVMFWDTGKWGLTNLAIPVFAELRAAGVFFDDPIDAARHVSEIWDDVGSWWENPAVREAVASFSVQFCRRSPDVVDGVRSELASVSGGR